MIRPMTSSVSALSDIVANGHQANRLLNATARWSCSPRSGQGLYNQAFMGRVAPTTHVGYDWMAHRHLPSPDFHRLDWAALWAASIERKAIQAPLTSAHLRFFGN